MANGVIGSSRTKIAAGPVAVIVEIGEAGTVERNRHEIDLSVKIETVPGKVIDQTESTVLIAMRKAIASSDRTDSTDWNAPIIPAVGEIADCACLPLRAKPSKSGSFLPDLIHQAERLCAVIGVRAFLEGAADRGGTDEGCRHSDQRDDSADERSGLWSVRYAGR